MLYNHKTVLTNNVKELKQKLINTENPVQVLLWEQSWGERKLMVGFIKQVSFKPGVNERGSLWMVMMVFVKLSNKCRHV